MHQNYIEVIKEAFNKGILDTEDARNLALATRLYFDFLQKVLQGDDLEAKKEAIATALEIKAFLDSKTAESMDAAASLTDTEKAKAAEIIQLITP